MAPTPRVVILGGGFGGLYAAKRLSGAGVIITLVDKRNHHLFQPLLYQVATAALNPSEIAMPLRRIFRRNPDVQVLLGEATAVDLQSRKVRLLDGELGYDYLIVATGSIDSYFGNDRWADVAPHLKTLEDAVEIRKRLLIAFEAAERESDEQRRKRWLTFVIVGGGPTGVELAGALSEIASHALKKDFRNIDPSSATVVLVEAKERLLPAFPERLSRDALGQLQKLGVTVITGRVVTEIRPDLVRVGDEPIEASTILWAAGIQASPLGKALGAPTDRSGRVAVMPDLSLPGHPEVFVIGDLASVQVDGETVPAMAQGAIQGGRHAADSIKNAIKGMPARRFRYKDKGTMATIGRAAAVAQLAKPHLALSGWLAWLLWLFIHILYLIGFRNRMLVLGQWAWSYIRWERGARLITGHEGPLLRPRDD